jgi:hypothetical protein
LTDEGRALAAWKLPPIVAAIAVSIVGGFYLGGPGLGLAVGALAAATIVVMAVRHPPVYPIVPAPARDSRDHLLVVVSEPLEDSGAIEQIANAVHAGSRDQAAPEVVVLALARDRLLDRWASDVGPARARARRTLVMSLASLAGAEVAASARIGAEDPVEAVEDQLRSYPATAVVLVSGGPKDDAAAQELEWRLQAPLHHLRCGTSKSAPMPIAAN